MALVENPCNDRVILDMWHPIVALDEIKPGRVNCTELLGSAVSYSRDPNGEPVVWRTNPMLAAGTHVDTETIGDRLPVITPVLLRVDIAGRPR